MQETRPWSRISRPLVLHRALGLFVGHHPSVHTCRHILHSFLPSASIEPPLPEFDDNSNLTHEFSCSSHVAQSCFLMKQPSQCQSNSKRSPGHICHLLLIFDLSSTPLKLRGHLLQEALHTSSVPGYFTKANKLSYRYSPGVFDMRLKWNPACWSDHL